MSFLQRKAIKALNTAPFRTNPTVRLLPLAELSLSQRKAIAGTAVDVRSLWLVRTEGLAGPVHKIISAETVRLLDALRTSSRLPAQFRRTDRPHLTRAVARLVLDSYLEVDMGSGFVGGPGAHSALLPPRSNGRPRRLVEVLTRQALDYANALDIDEPGALGNRLYRFNRLPDSRDIRTLLPTPAAVRGFLGLDGRSAIAALLRRHWRGATKSTARGYPWTVYFPAAASPSSGPLRFKLYLSPRVESLPEALTRLIPALADLGAPRFKVGRDRSNLLRPDKLVVYFSSLAAQRRARRRLRPLLAGLAPHGVPFTAADDDGVLSWGIDPAKTALGIEWSNIGSWRAWVATRLATYLIAAKVPGAPVDGVSFALDRLALDGVDTRRWIAQE